MKTATEPVTKTATGLQLAVLHLLLLRLNDCRKAVPGIGGDIDASNVRWMIERAEWHSGTVAQATDALTRLSGQINNHLGRELVKAKDALEALAQIKTIN